MTAKLPLYPPVFINSGTTLDEMAIFSTNLWFPVSLGIKNLQIKP
jgi:hypothetical protein